MHCLFWTENEQPLNIIKNQGGVVWIFGLVIPSDWLLNQKLIAKFKAGFILSKLLDYFNVWICICIMKPYQEFKMKLQQTGLTHLNKTIEVHKTMEVYVRSLCYFTQVCQLKR